MSEPQPLVSIVMPVLNATPFLAQAIDSIVIIKLTLGLNLRK